MEHLKKWSVDADIHIDYRTNGVSFSHSKSLPYPLMLLFAVLAGLFFWIWIVSMIFIAIVMSISAIAVGIWFSSILFSSTRFTRIFLNHRTKGLPLRQVAIHNPDRTVIYTTRFIGCVIDVEYPESMKQQLVSASLIGKKAGGRIVNSRVKELTITLDGKADGDLVIKEY